MNEMTRPAAAGPQFDRTQEDLGNVVELGHVNVTVPDQRLATLFYISGLGLTRDPYLMTGIENMWVNIGRAQFHLPSRAPQVVRGTTALVMPDRPGLLRRLAAVAKHLDGTKFAFHETEDAVETICPWGNRIRVHAPDPARFGPVRLGMPYVEFDIPEGTPLQPIADFYIQILGGVAGLGRDARGEYAWALVGDGNQLIYRPGPQASAAYDGHHVQISLVDFSGPHRRLAERGLISEESDQHQYRFQDLIDPASGKVLYTIEHEVRSTKHPMYARPLVNRNPDMTNRNYVPGYEIGRWALPEA